MADIVQNKNIGALIDEAAAFSYLSWTAGGGSDSATWTGISIDREGFATGSLPRSLDAIVFFDTVLASGHTLSITWDVQHSTNNSSWTDYATESATVVATGISGGSRQVGKARMTVQSTADNPSPGPGINLQSAYRYVRLNVLPHLSAPGTDTAVIAGIGVFGGFDQLASPTT